MRIRFGGREVAVDPPVNLVGVVVLNGDAVVPASSDSSTISRRGEFPGELSAPARNLFLACLLIVRLTRVSENSGRAGQSQCRLRDSLRHSVTTGAK